MEDVRHNPYFDSPHKTVTEKEKENKENLTKLRLLYNTHFKIV